MVAEDIDVKYEDAIKRCKGVGMRHKNAKNLN